MLFAFFSRASCLGFGTHISPLNHTKIASNSWRFIHDLNYVILRNVRDKTSLIGSGLCTRNHTTFDASDHDSWRVITWCFTWWNIRVIFACIYKWIYQCWWISGRATSCLYNCFLGRIFALHIFLFRIIIKIKPPQFFSLSLDLSNMIYNLTFC